MVSPDRFPELRLPDIDGLEICHEIRPMGQTPVVMLTARSAEDDIVDTHVWSIAKGLLEAMGGSIRLADAPVTGVCWAVSLPKTGPASEWIGAGRSWVG